MLRVKTQIRRRIGQLGQDQVRAHRTAAIGKARGHGCQLQRRGQHVALADAGLHRIAVKPALIPLRALPGLGRHHALNLAGYVDHQIVAKAQTPGDLGHLLRSDALAHLVEPAVARLDQRLPHIHAAVALALPAVEGLRPDLGPARAGHDLGRVNADFQRGEHGDHLVGRARRVVLGGALVDQRSALVLDQIVPVLVADPRRENRLVKAGV